MGQKFGPPPFKFFNLKFIEKTVDFLVFQFDLFSIIYKKVRIGLTVIIYSNSQGSLVKNLKLSNVENEKSLEMKGWVKTKTGPIFSDTLLALCDKLTQF